MAVTMISYSTAIVAEKAHCRSCTYSKGRELFGEGSYQTYIFLFVFPSEPYNIFNTCN